jgi:hypothetical protein
MSKGLEEVTVKTLKARCCQMGIQAEMAALESTSEPRGHEVAIFAVICAGQPVGLFSDEISDELQTQKIPL